MNAKTLEKLILFREKFGKEIMKEIIFKKIYYQFYIVKKRKDIYQYKERIEMIKNTTDLFVVEAYAAKQYWGSFKMILLRKYDWRGRVIHGTDHINKLLDIGYHYLTNEMAKNFEEIELPYELGFLHKAQGAAARPLVYDYIEWLRPIVVDKTLINFINRKKKKIDNLSSKDIKYFIYLIKKQLDKKYFNSNLGYYITLRFWIRLNILNLLKAINTNTYPVWRFPTLRHESRIAQQKTPHAEQGSLKGLLH